MSEGMLFIKLKSSMILFNVVQIVSIQPCLNEIGSEYFTLHFANGQGAKATRAEVTEILRNATFDATVIKDFDLTN